MKSSWQTRELITSQPADASHRADPDLFSDLLSEYTSDTLTPTHQHIILTGIITNDFTRTSLAANLERSPSTVANQIHYLEKRLGATSIAQSLYIICSHMDQQRGASVVNASLQALHPFTQPTPPITLRERQVVETSAARGNRRTAAFFLGVTPSTVMNTNYSCYRKLSLASEHGTGALPIAYLALRKLNLLPLEHTSY